MLKFVIRKMLSKKWMVLSLLIGNILLISIAAGNPMYTHAVFQRTLTKKLEAHLADKNTYPGLVTLKIENQTKSPAKLMEYAQDAVQIPDAIGVRALEEVQHLYTSEYRSELLVPRDDVNDLRVSINSMSDLPEHIQITAGRMYSAQPSEDGTLEAIISERAMIRMGVLLDDVVILTKLLDENENPMRVRITGIFTYRDTSDLYWVRTPDYYGTSCFIEPTLFESLFLPDVEELAYSIGGNWYTLLDYTAMRGDQAEAMLAAADAFREEFNQSVHCYTDEFSALLTDYIKTVKKVDTTLWVLQVPIFILLAAFIFMVSRQMIDIEQNEIAVLKSRGAGKGQIFGIYLLQSLLISLLALAAGIPLGSYLVQVLGSSNAFLEFVRRSALPIELTPKAMIFAGTAALLSIATMVLPALRYSKTSIVNHKRQKTRKSQTPLWQKLGLDVILLGIAIYGLYTFDGQKEMLAARVQDGASLDPLLFLSSSLFMIGSGLLAVRLVPVIVWTIYHLFKRLWSPALYASFLHVLRTRTSQSFMMVFLIMTIALGVFNAQAARTINQNTEDNLHYSVGADIVLMEKWTRVDEDENDESAGMYIEPDFGRYQNLTGAESITRVYVDNKTSTSVKGGSLKDVTLMGIHTKEFGETAWFKDTLSDIHWYHYLNAMSKNSRAILVSRNFQTKYKCELGDSITYRGSQGESLRGVIYGFVDYFPGYEPIVYKRGSNGLYSETDNYLIVAHLQQIQSSWGVFPYQIWIKNSGPSSAYLYDFADENKIAFSSLYDTNAMMVEKKNDPILQGTNGILTVGFIVVLLLCSVGFLIYWILSIQSRSLLFGIFRAMGMTMREVFTMLINEQFFISGLSIAVGAVVGQLTSKLYMPLIQLGYAASDNALPLEVISHSSDNIRLFVVVGAVMLLCMVILGALISHMKIAQALKLGED